MFGRGWRWQRARQRPGRTHLVEQWIVLFEDRVVPRVVGRGRRLGRCCYHKRPELRDGVLHRRAHAAGARGGAEEGGGGQGREIRRRAFRDWNLVPPPPGATARVAAGACGGAPYPFPKCSMLTWANTIPSALPGSSAAAAAPPDISTFVGRCCKNRGSQLLFQPPLGPMGAIVSAAYGAGSAGAMCCIVW